MDMDGMDHGMGSMSMGQGVPGLFYMQNMYWAVVGSAIAFATLVNMLNVVLAMQRLHSKDAKPKSAFWLSYATATAVCREISYASLGVFRIKGITIRLPTLGKAILVLSNLVVILVLCFYKLDTLDQWKWEDIGYRTGFIALSQLPLIFLLAGKDNLIGALTGFGYERLNWLHRWTARTLWLTVTIHMGFWFRSWARYDFIKVKLTTDPITQRGFAAWCILTFILASSFAPARRWNYELFILMHIVLFAGFTGAVWIHVPNEVKIFVWIPIGFFFFDRLLRLRRVLHLNLNIFRWRRLRVGGLWANSATLTPLPGNVTRISVSTAEVTWKPGQHMFLSCHSVVPLQSHPFTITSLPSDGKMEFLVQAKRGGTRRFFDHASRYSRLPDNEGHSFVTRKKVAVEGPYGRMRSLPQFDSVVFFAGSTGATFTVPHMRHLVRNWMLDRENRLKPTALPSKSATVTRRIRFVWVIKSREQLTWFSGQLEEVLRDVTICRSARDELSDKEVDMSIYVTCDEELVAEKAKTETCCQPITHGRVEDASLTTVNKSVSEKEKQQQADNIEVTSVASSSTNSRPATSDGCGPDGGCCCRDTVEDEADAPICCCTKPAEPTALKEAPAFPPAAESDEGYQGPSVNPPMRVLAGRPHPRSIIRKVLEEAEGESAVVVCGPEGLRDDVRESVVALSDERAVHKGTGAQGVYLHAEGFFY